jgi:DNA mismatch repair ATPase MutL
MLKSLKETIDQFRINEAVPENFEKDHAEDMHPELLALAKQHLMLDNFKTYNSDRLDWHDCHKGSLAKAIKAAYDLGRDHGYKKGNVPPM